MVVYYILYGNWVKSHKVDLALAYNILMGIDFIVFLMDRVSSVLPNPDESLRIEMSTRIGRKPNQVEYWFQNRTWIIECSCRLNFYFIS